MLNSYFTTSGNETQRKSGQYMNIIMKHYLDLLRKKRKTFHKFFQNSTLKVEFLSLYSLNSNHVLFRFLIAICILKRSQVESDDIELDHVQSKKYNSAKLNQETYVVQILYLTDLNTNEFLYFSSFKLDFL